MQKKYSFIYLLIVGVVFMSCKKIIDIELEEGDRVLVVDAWFTTESKVHEIKLTQSTDFYDSEPIPQVSGAEVYITGGGETFYFTETAPGVYNSAPGVSAKMHTNYTLNITYNGITYSASDYCDTVPVLDDMMPYPAYDDEGILVGYDLLIWTTELAGYGDYYAWRVLKNGQYESDTLSDIDFGSDDYIGDGLYFEAWPISFIEELNSGDTVRLEQHNITKSTYDAFMAVMLETEWRGGIFDAPPSNVPSNISNGAMGHFTVSSVSTFDFIVP